MNALNFELSGNILKKVSGYNPASGSVNADKCYFRISNNSDFEESSIITAAFWRDRTTLYYAEVTKESDTEGYCKIPSGILNDSGTVYLALIAGAYAEDDTEESDVATSTIVQFNSEMSVTSEADVELPDFGIYLQMLDMVKDFTPGTDKVATEAIQDSAVTADKIADSAVTSDKIADEAITTAKIADRSISTIKIQAAAVTANELASNSVYASKIVDKQVTTEKIANEAVTALQIADDSVITDKIPNGAVTALKTSFFTKSNTNIIEITDWTDDQEGHQITRTSGYLEVNQNTVYSFDFTPNEIYTSIEGFDSDKNSLGTLEYYQADDNLWQFDSGSSVYIRITHTYDTAEYIYEGTEIPDDSELTYILSDNYKITEDNLDSSLKSELTANRCSEVSMPLPTIFSNSYLNAQLAEYDSTAAVISPKNGDKLLNTVANAVYGYREYSGAARVYVYQCVKDGETLASNGDYIGKIIGNFSGYDDNVDMLTGSGQTLSDIGSDNFYNENNSLFRNTALQLVAAFELENPCTDGSFEEIWQYAIDNADSFPKLKLVGGDLNDALIVVKFRGKNKVALSNVPYISSDTVDNALAVMINETKYFEYWAADCWYEGNGTYLDGTSASDINTGESESNDYTIYYADQGGGNGATLVWANSTTAHSAGTKYTFDEAVESVAESGGEWVYEGAITDVSYMRNIEASSDSITTASGNSSLSYQTLDTDAKSGDIHIKTPSSILSLTSAQIWQCKYAVKDKQKQVWEKIF